MTTKIAPEISYREIPLADIIVGANVRKVVILDKGFLDSIKAAGVIQPILVTAAPKEDGKFIVLGWTATPARLDRARHDIDPRDRHADT